MQQVCAAQLHILPSTTTVHHRSNQWKIIIKRRRRSLYPWQTL